MKRQTVKPKEIYGLVVVLWFGIGIMITVFFILGQIKTDLDFKTTLAFGFAYLLSRSYLYAVEGNWKQTKAFVQSKNRDNPLTFWQEPLKREHIRYIILGTLLVFGSAFLGTALKHPILTPIIALTLSGLVLMWVLFKTENILAPIWIHGTWNGFVIALKYGVIPHSLVPEEFKQSLLSINPIFVPEVGLGFEGFSKILTEIIFQYMLVSTTEELMKVALTVFFILSFKGYFTKKGATKYEAGFLAVMIWVGLHTIQAVQL